MKLSKQNQIIASNIDQALLLITLNNPPTFFAFIDRFLITAQAYQIPVILIFNKMDTYTDDDRAEVQWMKSIYEALDYPCHEISCFDAKDIEKNRRPHAGESLHVLRPQRGREIHLVECPSAKAQFAHR